MRVFIAIVVCVAVAVPGFGSGGSPPKISDLVGDWSGASLCQVNPSPCHDENVVFRFSNPHEDKITVRADKIVDGKPVTMGSASGPTPLQPAH